MLSEHRRTPEHVIELSGRTNERFVFGEVRTHDPQYEAETRALIGRFRDQRKAIPLRDAVGVIKHFQPFQPDSRKPVDPEYPIKQFPRALRKYVADHLIDPNRKKVRRILFWTAVSSFVDRGLGADAVIEAEWEDESPSAVIPLDVTLRNPRTAGKEKDPNRVIIYGEIPDPQFERKAFDEKVIEIGREVVKKFLLL